jgi:hypothetical protein
MKPLHYLREGTIYLFDVPESDKGDLHGHRLEHYWLCGDCASTHLLEKTANHELRLAPRKSSRFVRRKGAVVVPSRALAS